MNFGNCPIHIIQSALKSHRQSEIRRLKEESRVTAKMGAYLLLSNGVKKAKPEWINDWEFVEKAIAIREFIPKPVGQAFMRLHKDGKLARWVVDAVNVEAFEIAAGE